MPTRDKNAWKAHAVIVIFFDIIQWCFSLHSRTTDGSSFHHTTRQNIEQSSVTILAHTATTKSVINSTTEITLVLLLFSIY